MNASTKQWESYFDDVGRRHWRWPASPPMASATTGAQGQQRPAPPRQQPVPLQPLHLRSK